jgi:gas vesicle protein
MSPKKEKSLFEKVMLGLVIGAAVGSVIGASVAPDEGKKTRAKLGNKIKDLTSEFKDKIIDTNLVPEAPVEPEKPKSIFRKLLDKLTNETRD